MQIAEAIFAVGREALRESSAAEPARLAFCISGKALGQNKWYHFGVGAPPIWGYRISHGHMALPRFPRNRMQLAG